MIKTLQVSEWIIEGFDIRRQEFTDDFWNQETPYSIENDARIDAYCLGLRPDMEGERPERCLGPDYCDLCAAVEHPLGWRLKEVKTNIELVQQPHVGKTLKNHPYYYKAQASSVDDPYEVWEVIWPTRPGYDAATEDESEACDWSVYTATRLPKASYQYEY